MSSQPTDERSADESATSSQAGLVARLVAGSTLLTRGQTVGARLTSWVRTSAIYRWLTAEPDPDVIVIDLRETWTVGPFLRVLDWVIDRLVDAASGSCVVALASRVRTGAVAAPLRVGGLLLAAVGIIVAASGLPGALAITRIGIGVGLAVAGVIAMQDDRDWATLRETRPVEIATAALEPPAPPDAEADDDAVESNRHDGGPSAAGRDDET